MKKIDKMSAAIGAVAAAGVIAVGVPAIASAASSTPSPSSTTAPGSRGAPGDTGRHAAAEKELTGTTAAKVKAAVLAKLPGATVYRMSAEDAQEGTGAAYEVHSTKADGSPVEVFLDKNFKVTSVRAGGGPGMCGGPGAGPARDGGPHFAAEKELTGATAARVKAAVLAKLPGATVRRLSAEDPKEGSGAAYEAHVTKADGTDVQVLLDKDFVVKTVTAEPRHPGFPGGPGPHR